MYNNPILALQNQLRNNGNNQQQQQQNLQLEQIKNMMKTIQNPQVLFNQNPMLQNIVNLGAQKGMDLKQTYYWLAKQRGIDADELLKQLTN